MTLKQGFSQFFILSSLDAGGTNMVKLTKYGKAAVNVVHEPLISISN